MHGPCTPRPAPPHGAQGTDDLSGGLVLRKSKAPRCAKRTRGDPFLDRWDAIGPDTLKGLCRDLRRNDKDLALTTSPPATTHGAMREYLRMYY